MKFSTLQSVRYYILAALLLLHVLTISTTLSAAERNPTAVQPFFRNIEKVGLYVIEPYMQELALRCHGLEDECARKNPAIRVHPEKREAYIASLRTAYKQYRRPIHKDSLQERFADELGNEFRKFNPSTDELITILDEKSVQGFSTKENALTVTVELRFLREGETDIALIEATYFRPECALNTYRNQLLKTRIAAIPLSVEDGELEKRIVDFIEATHISSSISTSRN